MNITITPTPLKGEIKIPPSKSVAHRMIISAALSRGKSVVTGLARSADIEATVECMKALGARIEFSGDTAIVEGIESPPEAATLDCNESGSTLRFLMPVAAALGVRTTFIGRGKLPTRPIEPYIEQFPLHGVTLDFSKANDGELLPCTLLGRLTAGEYSVSGGISSQFITGLLFALPLLSDDSKIILTSHLESKPYVDITLGTLAQFGGVSEQTDYGYFVKGNQRLLSHDGEVEGDYSQAAFFEVANVLGSNVKILGLNEKSFQGDKKIVEICKEIVYNKSTGLSPFDIDCSDIPDLVPILSVLGCFCEGKSFIRNAARLRIKECDRLHAMAEVLNAIGGRVTELDDGLQIVGVGTLTGGEVTCFNDHRIAMSAAIAATRCTGKLTLHGAECVKKSYPNFWEDIETLGGKLLRD